MVERSAAMAHNRLADREIDAANPRTASRALSAGTLSIAFVRVFFAASIAVFLAAAASLNRLTFLLSPVALGLLLVYAYTKRFTAASHLVLGLCLALAPVGAWIAVRGSRSCCRSSSSAVLVGPRLTSVPPRDEEHDRRAGLKSVPSLFGTRTASSSTVLHAAMVPLLVAVWRLSGGSSSRSESARPLPPPPACDHQAGRDLSRINTAFFTANGIASLTLPPAASRTCCEA
jgi:4-hydroxybenzoate polyprenyltransferase